jgi:hypothetical protein
MGEIIRFVPKSERERGHLIREALPPGDPVDEEQNKGPVSHAVSGANASCSGGGPVS